MRVHELARELGVASKEILAALEGMGLEGRTALSSVPEEAVPRLRASGGRPVPVMPRAPGPWLGPPPALRRTTRAARAARTPLFRTRQDRVMAAAAVLLFAGTFSTFAILGPDPAPPVSRVSPRVVLPALQLESSPTGGDLATLDAPAAAEPSPSPRPRLRVARGAGVASAGAATSLLPSAPEPSGLAPAAVQPTEPPPPTVRPSPPTPTTDPPEPPPPPTTDPPAPSPSPTESPSPSPSPSDEEDCWPPAPPHCDDDD